MKTSSLFCAAALVAPAAFCASFDALPASLAKVRPLSTELTQALGGDRLPPSDITAVTTESGAAWTRRADGAWVAPATSRPSGEVITLSLVAKTGGSYLRLDFPTDASLPALGPGQAENGNAVIGEIEIEVGGRPVKAAVFTAVSQSHEGRVAACAFDGVKSPDDPGWDTEASGFETGGGKPAQLIARLNAPVAPGARVTVRLLAKSRWAQHVPGTVAAAFLDSTKAAPAAKQLAELQKEFEAWRARVASPRGDLLAESQQLALAQAELLRVTGDTVKLDFFKRKDAHDFLTTFLNDQAWLESFLLGGSEGTDLADYAQSLENLRLLFANLPRDTRADPVLKRLATAIALQAGDMNRYRLVERFRLIAKARADGRLHSGFERLDVRLMRHAINLTETPFDFDDWLDQARFPREESLGSCFAVPYLTVNPYGIEISDAGFHEQFRYAYPHGKIFRLIGGMCGTLSRFGATATYTRGIPSFTVPQPGHSAYLVRIGDRWETGNDVFGPDSNGWRMDENLSFSATNALLEITENAPAHLHASRQLRAARIQRARGLPVAVWRASYEAALRTQPTNFAAWLEYTKALEATPGSMTPAAWSSLATRAAHTFAAHQETAWTLAQRCLDNAKSRFPTPASRVAALLEIHRILNQTSAPSMYGYPIGNYLNRQADWIGDDALAADFYGKLLVLHRSDNPNLNWIFGHVLGWGAERFGKSPEHAVAYAKAMGAYFSALGAKADQGQLRDTLAAGIRAAATGRDPATWRTWMNLVAKLLPAPVPADVHMTPDNAAERPKLEPFPGTLLSATGMLSLSSISYDNPFSHDRVLNGDALGYFDTAAEPAPWATVTLAGDGELSGIVLVGRYELPSEQPWDVPLKVEISTDDKTWTQVALIEKAAPVYRIDLRGKNLRARYIRIERQAPADATAQPGRLHMRNFLVFGRKLY